MKRFKFRLARLESLRDLRRRQARSQLAIALAEEREAQLRRRDAERNRDAAHSLLLPDEIAHQPRAMKQLSEWQAALRRISENAGQLELRAEEKSGEAAVEHKRCAQEHRALERLRERRFLRWLEESGLEEQKFLDEAHLLRMMRLRGKES